MEGIQTIYDVLDRVRAKSWAFLEQDTLGHLSTFWLAYTAFSRFHDVSLDMGDPDFRHFGLWVAARRGDGLHTGGWQHFLALEAPSSGGLDLFFRELDEFRRRRLKAVARASVGSPRIWPKYVVMRLGDVESIAPDLAPVTHVELRAYFPDDAYFLVAIRADGVETEHWCWTKDRAMELAEKELSVNPEDWHEMLSPRSQQ